MKFIIYGSASKHMRLLQTVFTLLVKFFHYNSLWVSIRIDRLIKVGVTSDVVEKFRKQNQVDINAQETPETKIRRFSHQTGSMKGADIRTHTTCYENSSDSLSDVPYCFRKFPSYSQSSGPQWTSGDRIVCSRHNWEYGGFRIELTAKKEEWGSRRWKENKGNKWATYAVTWEVVQ